MTTNAETLDELADELRDSVLRFVTAVSLIECDSDGVPCRLDQAFEWERLTSHAHRLVSVLRSPAGTPVGSVRILAREWTCVVAAFQVSGATESNRRIMGRRWLAARAQVADLLGIGPRVHLPDTTDDGSQPRHVAMPIDSPEVRAMVAADPDLLGFIEQACRQAGFTESGERSQ